MRGWGNNQLGEDSILGVMGWVLPRFGERKAADVGQSIFFESFLLFFSCFKLLGKLATLSQGRFSFTDGVQGATAPNAVYNGDQGGKGAFTKPTI